MSNSFIFQEKYIILVLLIFFLVVISPAKVAAVKLAGDEGKAVSPAATAGKKPAAAVKTKAVKQAPRKAPPTQQTRPREEKKISTTAEAPSAVSPPKEAAAAQVPEVKQAPPPSPAVINPAATQVSPPKAPAREPRYVTIDFDNVDIGVFIKFVSELTGKNFIVDDKVRGKVTIVSPKKIALDDVYRVFEQVLEVYGFAALPSGDMIKIVPSLQAREKHMDTLIREDEAIPRDDRIVTNIISLDHASPDEVKKVLDPLISKSSVIISYPPTGMLIITDFLSNINKLREIIAALDVEGVAAQITYLPLKFAQATEIVKALTAVFQPLRGGPVTVRVIADERTNAIIVMASESDAERVKKLISFMDRDVPRAEVTLRVYRLQNALAEDLVKVLMNIPKDSKDPAQKGRPTVLSREIHVSSDKATNNLIVTASRDDYRVLEDVIRKLDQPRPMVYIEALIMEVGVNKDFRLGVEWRAAHDLGHVSGFDTGRSAVIAGSGGLGQSGAYNIIPGVPKLGEALPFPGGFSLGVLGAGISIGGVLFPNIGAIVQAYQRDSDVSILATPQIMTIDNEEAEITVGKNVPYITRQDKSGTTGVDYSNYEYKDVGVTLNIVPHINEDGFVRLKLSKKVTKVVKEESALGLPTTLKREAKTTVVIKDKETIVIGGLVGDSTEMGNYKVPWFGDIPLLGWLFKSKSRGGEKSNLYVFLTPYIVRTQADATDLMKQKQKQVEKVIEEGVIKLKDRKAPPKERAEPVEPVSLGGG